MLLCIEECGRNDCDGEAIILEQGLDPDLINALDTSEIALLKGVPGAKSCHQSSDRSTVFKDSKFLVAKNLKNAKNVSNTVVEGGLDGAFAGLQKVSNFSCSCSIQKEAYLWCIAYFVGRC